MNIKEFFDQLIIGNASVITSENTLMINQLAMVLYDKDELNSNEVEELKYILMSCNILYNRTDLTVLPIEDGFYDLLLEKYKNYDPHFQVGSAIVNFKNFIENDFENPQKIAVPPIIFREPIKRDEVHEVMHDSIMKTSLANKYDFSKSPISFINDSISKRTHNTEHNHPSLVGTLDKCKFVFTEDAVRAGVDKDPNVKILERDFFANHISKGIINPNQKINVVCELKYDGISVEADCGLELYSARTRGDTGIGAAADITPILQGYPFKQAKCMIGEKPIGVKFEAIMTKSNLYNFNIARQKSYKNCRTAIVGLFGSSDAYMFRDYITLVPLALDRDDIPSITNRMEEIEFLNKVFASSGNPLRYCYMSGTVQEILFMIKAFWDEAIVARDYLDFMYDGIVVSYLDEDIRNKLGRENYINKFSMAVKFNPLEKQTIFRGFTYEVGQNGQVTPMIHYDPVEFLGTIHTKSTGSSLQRFNKLGLRYGDIISVTYVNDVMPYVSKYNCESNRKNSNPNEQFITHCPICGSILVESESGKTMMCGNIECPGRSVQRMSNMFQKLNIKGFSDASIKALGMNYLYELTDLDEEYIISRLKDANGHSMYVALQELKKNPIKDYIIMGSLGFASIAHKKWQSILENIRLKDLYQMYLESNSENEFRERLLAAYPRTGDVTSYIIAKEFPFFEKDIINIINNFNIIDSFGNNNEGKIQVRFTGCRNKHLCELLCNAGYDADDSSSAGKKTNILIVPYEGFVSTKTTKVSESCRIIPIDYILTHLNEFIQ